MKQNLRIQFAEQLTKRLEIINEFRELSNWSTEISSNELLYRYCRDRLDRNDCSLKSLIKKDVENSFNTIDHNEYEKMCFNYETLDQHGINIMFLLLGIDISDYNDLLDKFKIIRTGWSFVGLPKELMENIFGFIINLKKKKKSLF